MTTHEGGGRIAGWEWNFDMGSDGTLLLRLSGSWPMRAHLPSRAAVEHELAARPAARAVAFDTSEIGPLAASLRSTLDGTRQLVSKANREVEPLAVSARGTLDATRQLVGKVDREVEPLAVSARSTLDAARVTVESAHGAVVTVHRALDGDTRLGDDLSQALHQLTAAARSLNALASYLQQHPEALLRGKEGSNVP